MSNFTDFFLPSTPGINTLQSFFVSPNNTPLGYNSSTGVYQHPNGTVWIETGKTLFSPTAEYSDANYSIGYGYTGNSYDLTSISGANPIHADAGAYYNKIGHDGTNYYWFIDDDPYSGNNFITRVYDTSFSYTGTQIGYGPGFSGQNMKALATIDSSGSIAGISDSNTLKIGTGAIWSIPVTALGGASNGTNWWFIINGTTITQTNSSGATTGITITATVGTPKSISYSSLDNYYYVLCSNKEMFRFTDNGTIDSSLSSSINGVSIADPTNMVASLTNSGAILIGDGSSTANTLYEFAPGYSYGISTAYTSSETSQKYFIRLK